VLEVGPGSRLYDWLSDGRATAALVRPDFSVMRAGRDVAALCEATPRFRVASECHGRQVGGSSGTVRRSP
jgi:3-(3-hydroxy-phenyl)propionate hydroxylase